MSYRKVAGGGELPLDKKLAGNFEFKTPWGITFKLSGVIELHRLAVDDPAQLERRMEEITTTIINSTCSMKFNDILYKEVRQALLPNCSPGDDTVPRLLLQSLGLGAAAAEQGRRSKHGDKRWRWRCEHPPVVCSL